MGIFGPSLYVPFQPLQATSFSPFGGWVGDISTRSLLDPLAGMLRSAGNFWDGARGVTRSWYGSLFSPAFDLFGGFGSGYGDILSAGARLLSWGNVITETNPYMFSNGFLDYYSKLGLRDEKSWNPLMRPISVPTGGGVPAGSSSNNAASNSSSPSDESTEGNDAAGRPTPEELRRALAQQEQQAAEARNNSRQTPPPPQQTTQSNGGSPPAEVEEEPRVPVGDNLPRWLNPAHFQPNELEQLKQMTIEELNQFKPEYERQVREAEQAEAARRARESAGGGGGGSGVNPPSGPNEPSHVPPAGGDPAGPGTRRRRSGAGSAGGQSQKLPEQARIVLSALSRHGFTPGQIKMIRENDWKIYAFPVANEQGVSDLLMVDQQGDVRAIRHSKDQAIPDNWGEPIGTVDDQGNFHPKS
ncbi:MAG: hypothetical protein Q7S68_00780 [Deltaproteobacteria bacterium]|nr:hypothetical protein [Deltaproteobacteria bacterium]